MSTEWSRYFQNPPALEYVRFNSIMPEYEPFVRKWCNIKDGANVIDIGCGTGYFTRILASGPEEIKITGLDKDDVFIDYARNKARQQNLDIDFIEGDALNLPFDADTFDVVASYTLLSSVKDFGQAFSEMKRVAKSGGLIASITPLRVSAVASHRGLYPSSCTWRDEFFSLDKEIGDLINQINIDRNYIAGITPLLIPHYFSYNQLKNVSVYPIGKYTSFSNPTMAIEDRLKYIELYEDAMVQKADAYMDFDEFSSKITHTKIERYKELIHQKCDYVRQNINDNSIWEYYAFVNILVTGIVEK